MSYLCLIPARGGSKGIPRKNLRPTAGKPLIQWTIDQARQAPVDLRVVVSTDDDEISAVAEECGADVPFRRPPALAADETQTEAVVLHALSELASQGYRPDAVVLLQATSPVRRPDTIARAIEQFEREEPDALVGVVAQPPFLWHRTDPPTAAYDVNRRSRRQDLTDDEQVYREVGSLYVTRTAIYEGEQNRLGGRISLFVMDEIEGIDIDSPLDHQLAELVLQELEATR
jgi:CMP-N,N'-diacetyllegionaminic acid synthase